MTGLQELYYISFFRDFILGFTKLNQKVVAQICSTKKLFLEISQNPQENMCRDLRPINRIIK